MSQVYVLAIATVLPLFTFVIGVRSLFNAIRLNKQKHGELTPEPHGDRLGAVSHG
jgi:hypothetical protein